MIERLLQRLAKALDSRQIPYMIIGGQAVLLYGSPRLTQDVDITLGVDIDALKTITSVCRRVGLKPLAKNVESFVQTTHVLPTQDRISKFRVEFIFSNTPYERQAIKRAKRVRIGRVVVRFTSAEDLIIHKLVAGRPLDVEDVRVLMTKHRHDINMRYVSRWLKRFADLGITKENPLLLFKQLKRKA